MTININEALDRVKNSIYGKDIRQAIVDSVSTVYDDAAKVGNANMEVVKARGTKATLAERLSALTAADFDVSSDSKRIKLSNLADEVRQAMAGTTPVNATPGALSVTSDKIAPDAVTQDKIQYKGLKRYKGIAYPFINVVRDGALPAEDVSFNNIILDAKLYGGDPTKLYRIEFMGNGVVISNAARYSITFAQYNSDWSNRVELISYGATGYPTDPPTASIDTRVYNIANTDMTLVLTIDWTGFGSATQINIEGSTQYPASSGRGMVMDTSNIIPKSKFESNLSTNVANGTAIGAGVLTNQQLKYNGIMKNKGIDYPFKNVQRNGTTYANSGILNDVVLDCRVFGGDPNKYYRIEFIGNGIVIGGTTYYSVNMFSYNKDWSGKTTVLSYSDPKLVNTKGPDNIETRIYTVGSLTITLTIDWTGFGSNNSFNIEGNLPTDNVSGKGMVLDPSCVLPSLNGGVDIAAVKATSDANKAAINLLQSKDVVKFNKIATTTGERQRDYTAPLDATITSDMVGQTLSFNIGMIIDKADYINKDTSGFKIGLSNNGTSQMYKPNNGGILLPVPGATKTTVVDDGKTYTYTYALTFTITSDMVGATHILVYEVIFLTGDTTLDRYVTFSNEYCDSRRLNFIGYSQGALDSTIEPSNISSLKQRVTTLETGAGTNTNLEISVIHDRIATTQDRNPFDWKTFDKAYVTLIFDDGRHDVDKVFNIFKEYDVACSLAIPSNALATYNTDSGSTVLSIAQQLVANPKNELLGHGKYHTGITSALTESEVAIESRDAQIQYRQLGFNKVRGSMVAGANDKYGTYTVSNYDDAGYGYMYRRYFDYGDNLAYDKAFKNPRTYFNQSLTSLKSAVDSAITSKTWLRYFAHTLDGSESYINEAQLRGYIEYVISKGVTAIEFTTYRDMFKKFGTTALEKRLAVVEAK